MKVLGIIFAIFGIATFALMLTTALTQSMAWANVTAIAAIVTCVDLVVMTIGIAMDW